MASVDSEKSKTESDGWRQILAGGGLVAAVGTVLILAAVLETPEAPARPAADSAARSSSANHSSPEARSVRPPTSSGWQPAAGPSSGLAEKTPAEETQSEAPVLDTLSRRALEDPARMRKSGGVYTAQIAFACRRETAERLLERSAESPNLYVLPEGRDGKDCFRLCWGSYDSREEAMRLPGLPELLKKDFAKPEAKRIAELAQ